MIALSQLFEQDRFAAAWRSLHHISIRQTPAFLAGEPQLSLNGVEYLRSSNKAEGSPTVSPIQKGFESFSVVFAERAFHSLDVFNSLDMNSNRNARRQRQAKCEMLCACRALRPKSIMSSRIVRSIANFLGFQATWWACALGAANGYPLIGPIIALAWLLIHIATLQDLDGSKQSLSAQRLLELKLILGAALVGYLCDSALIVAGFMEFPPGVGAALPTTPWMVALWMAFAATLRHSMNWLRGRFVLGLAAGAIFAPLAYRAGEALGALTLAPAPFGLLAVAAVWLLAIPLLLWLRERLEGVQQA